MRCTYKRIDKIRLCPSDLTHLVTVSSRTIIGDHPDSIEQDTTELAALYDSYAAIETVKPYAPVESLASIRGITHIFYFRFTDIQVPLDSQSQMIICEGENYRIDSVLDINNFHETMAVYCVKRGNENEGNA